MNEEKERVMHWKFLNSISTPVLHRYLNASEDEPDWKEEMAISRIQILCSYSKEKAAEWFALEEGLKNNLNEEMMKNESHAIEIAWDIADIEARVYEMKKYLGGDKNDKQPL